MKKNQVAIIILNHNKKSDLFECIQSILKQDYDNYKIIVVDNASTDGSYEEIKKNYPDILVINSTVNLGVAGGRNIGIKFTLENPDFANLLFLDNDVIIETNFISELIKPLDDIKIGIVTPKCYSMNGDKIIGYAGGLNINLFTGKISDRGGGEKDVGQFENPRFVSSAGGLFLARKKLFETIGLFDEKFNPYGWEDVDISLRAQQNGFKIFYNPKAVVYHKGGKKLRKLNKVYEISKIKNFFYLLRKHTNLLQKISILVFIPFRIISLAGKELKHRLLKSNF